VTDFGFLFVGGVVLFVALDDGEGADVSSFEVLKETQKTVF